MTGNDAVVSVKVPDRLRKKMKKIDIKWGDILRRAIEKEVRQHERKRAVSDLLEFTKQKPRNRSGKSVEAFLRETREER
ncbi:MAG: hypothetical protein ACREAW_01015 [Nitrososphaera sp.]